jgi:hypothetical protein
MRYFLLLLLFGCGSDAGSPNVETTLGEETEKEKCPIEQAKGELNKTENSSTEQPTKKEETKTVSVTPTASTTTASVATTTETTTTTTATTTENAACGSIVHGASGSRTRYQASSVSYGSSCVSETQSATCTNGTLGTYSGTYTNESCSAQAPSNCGQTLHGQTATRTKYQASSVAFGQTCSSETQTATCSNGTLNYSGSFTYDSCSINDPAACGATANGAYASRTRYQASSVAYGSTCSSEAQTALCTNGTLASYSGSYAYDSCSVNSPAACGATPHGGTVTRTKYQASSVAYGSTCSSETQSATCNNGSFGSYSGTYTFDSCSVNAPANCGAVNHGNSISRTRYQNLTVAWNASCTSEAQTSTCNNGTMGAYTGTYTYGDCAVRNRYFEEALMSNLSYIKTLSGIKTDGTTVMIGSSGGLVASGNMTSFGLYSSVGAVIRALQIDPTTHNWFFAGGSVGTYGLRYYNGSWSWLTSGGYALNTGSGQISVLVKDLYSASTKVWAATPNGIYYSSDTGVTFELKTAEPARSIFKSVSGALVVNTESNGLIIYPQTTYAIYKNFTTSTGLPSNTVNSSWCDASCWGASGKWVIGTSSGLALSTNGGSSFTTKTTGNGLPSNNILFVHVPNIDGQTIYLGTEGGLAISTDGGANWTTRYTGSDSNINGIITYGSDIWMTSSSWGLWKLQ